VDERDNLETTFSTPTNLMGASSRDKWQGETDELGRKIYVAPSGRKYAVGSSAGSRSLPQVARDVYEAIPPMEDWRMPTGQEVASGAKAVAKGAYEGAKHVIETPTNPDATLGDVWGVAGSMPVGVGAARVAGVKAPEDALGIFAGASAKNADLTSYQLAKRLEGEGWKPDAIWRQTGWAKGPDDRWVWEIDDSQADFQPSFNIPDRKEGVIGETKDAFFHPSLYDNYPAGNFGKTTKLTNRAANATLGVNALGDYNPISKSVRVRDGAEARSTMIHELSHSAQAKDGAASGANPDYIYNTVKAELENLPDEAQDYLYRRGNVVQYTDMINESLDSIADAKVKLKRATDPLEEALGEETIKDLEEQVESFKAALATETTTLQGLHSTLGPDFSDRLNEVSDILAGAQEVGAPASFNADDAFKMYESDPGEYYARKAQGRMDMNAEDRLRHYPFRDMPKNKPDQATILKNIAGMATARFNYQRGNSGPSTSTTPAGKPSTSAAVSTPPTAELIDYNSKLRGSKGLLDRDKVGAGDNVLYRPDRAYRFIGSGGYNDFLESGIVRAKPGSKQGYEVPYFMRGQSSSRYGQGESGDFLVETVPDKSQWKGAGQSFDDDKYVGPTKGLTKNDPIRIFKRQKDGSFEIVFDNIGDTGLLP
jgi:hypothetical protein